MLFMMLNVFIEARHYLKLRLSNMYQQGMCDPLTIVVFKPDNTQLLCLLFNGPEVHQYYVSGGSESFTL